MREAASDALERINERAQHALEAKKAAVEARRSQVGDIPGKTTVSKKKKRTKPPGASTVAGGSVAPPDTGTMKKPADARATGGAGRPAQPDDPNTAVRKRRTGSGTGTGTGNADPETEPTTGNRSSLVGK